MTYCNESELLDSDYIYSLLGSPFRDNTRLLTISGSGGYFIDRIVSGDSFLAHIPDDAKANIQRREKGLLIAFNKSNRLYGISLEWNEIDQITLTKGKEQLQPKFPLPVWWLIRLGLPVEKAKYFGLFGEFKQEPLRLEIGFDNQVVALYANGFSFDEKAFYFSALSVNTKVIIE
tara:strand:+ start:316 stop:840 length:525 start_codon:yes stop_codon:yes gene_type:complete